MKKALGRMPQALFYFKPDVSIQCAFDFLDFFFFSFFFLAFFAFFDVA